MTEFLILIAIVIFICVLLNNATSRIGMPVLLAFILLGMLFGNNGLLPIRMENYKFVENICTASLIFIMFYGGFGTNWNSARPVAVESVLMATVGVALTAGFTGLFCHYVLHWEWVESFLMGSVISSTDAASVFSILKSKSLGLKNGTASLLEVESGSNDPCSYMLTAIMLSLMQGSVSTANVVGMLFAQLGFGLACGAVIALAASYAMKKMVFATAGFDSMFLIAIALFSYAIPTAIGGNGYLSAYIVGIVVGNQQFTNKKEMVHFFDGFTGLMQVIIFFMLGLLAHPAELHKSILPALAIFFVLLLVARPLASLILLTPFKKYGLRGQALVSFCGLRGAASIVFAIMATLGNTLFENDIFNIVFCIVLLSIALQGTLIPYVAKGLNMIDDEEDVMRTFSDFSDEVDLQFTEVRLHKDSPWADRQIMDIGIPKDLLICMVIKPDGTKVVPNGHSMLSVGDQVIICSKLYEGSQNLKISQIKIIPGSKHDGQEVRHYMAKKSQLILIRRNEESIIPHGSTVIKGGDILYINKSI